MSYIFLSRRGNGLVELEEPLETQVSASTDHQEDAETSEQASETDDLEQSPVKML